MTRVTVGEGGEKKGKESRKGKENEGVAATRGGGKKGERKEGGKTDGHEDPTLFCTRKKKGSGDSGKRGRSLKKRKGRKKGEPITPSFSQKKKKKL